MTTTTPMSTTARLGGAALAAATGLALLAAPAVAQPPEHTYEVSVTNLTSGQPLTPPLWATHRSAVDLFTVGEPASDGIREIAENGNLSVAVAATSTNRHVTSSGVALRDGDGPPPILPGETRTFTIATTPSGNSLSFASMLICTNDGFTGLDTVRLPRQVGAAISVETAGYDAGTERNTEDFADIVPPCPALTGVATDDPGTGTSDPGLVEGGVITHHAGVTGVDDLQVGLHGWDTTGPVAVVTVERTS